MSLVNGQTTGNAVGFFFENGQWYPAVCSRSISIQVATDIVETSVSGTGPWRTIAPTKNSWNFTNEGLVALNVPGGLTIADIESRMRAHTLMMFRFQQTTIDGSIYTDAGYCYITGATKVSSFDNVSTWNISAEGTGPLTQVFTPIVQPTPIVYRYQYTATGGETSFTDAALINKQVIAAGKDMQTFPRVVVGAATPASNEIVYDPATGTTKWNVPAEAGEGLWLDFQNL